VREDELVEVFADVLRGIGLEPAEPEQGDVRSDLAIDLGGKLLAVELKGAGTVSAGDLSQRLERWEAQADTADRAEVLPVLVADTIVESAREVLRNHGWGWLDLRGHLYLRAPGVFVDSDVPPLRERPGRARALSGVVGLEVACLILLDPDRPLSVRSMARALKRSASTVSNILGLLRDDGRIARDGTVDAQSLFWRVADVWPRNSTALASAPGPGTGAKTGSVDAALRLGLEDVESAPGWALTDTLAAALYGAPVGVRSDYPPDFYVPTPAVQRRAVELLGPATDWARRRATVKVAPVPMVCGRRVDGAARKLGNEHWPLAHPLFVALDLAGDPGRGSEILQGWRPPKPWRRVW
jgi:hypothetical protein